MILSLSIRRAKQSCSFPPVAARCLPHALRCVSMAPGQTCGHACHSSGGTCSLVSLGADGQPRRACAQLPHTMPVPHVTASFRFYQLCVAAPVAPCPHRHAPGISPFPVSVSISQMARAFSCAHWPRRSPGGGVCSGPSVFLMSGLPFSQCSFSIVAFTRYTVLLPPSVTVSLCQCCRVSGWMQPFLSLSSSRI